MKIKIFTKSLSTLLLSLLLLTSACKQEVVYSSKVKDEGELKTLRSEIQKMSDQVNCDNPAGWKFVPIGSKPCGGATGFVVYSINIDTCLFLQKVADYNNKQKTFNVKWNLVSDCSIIIAPKSITCEMGKPKLVY